jgi:hypothetical protein
MIDLNEDTIICRICGKAVVKCPHFNYQEEDYDPPSTNKEVEIVMEAEL